MNESLIDRYVRIFFVRMWRHSESEAEARNKDDKERMLLVGTMSDLEWEACKARVRADPRYNNYR